MIWVADTNSDSVGDAGADLVCHALMMRAHMETPMVVLFAAWLWVVVLMVVLLMARLRLVVLMSVRDRSGSAGDGVLLSSVGGASASGGADNGALDGAAAMGGVDGGVLDGAAASGRVVVLM